MAKTEILTKDGLTIYDEKMKSYIKEKIDDTVYIDPDEASSDLPDIDAVTSAKYVTYNNADSNLEATNVQEAIDELKESIGSGSGETVNIVDNLESTSADSALSANQGRVVNKKVDEVNTYLQRKPSKNLLKITVDSGFSELGVTFTVNEDKSLTLNGTRTGFTKSDQTIGTANLKAGIEYILSGCPEGGSGSTYRLMVHNDVNPSAGVSDIGEGVIFTVPSDGEYRISTILAISYTYDGITYYPMIREATVEDDTYEPYYEDAMSIVNNALVHGDVVDNLISTRADLPVSANQVRIVNDKITSRVSPIYTKTLALQNNTGFTFYIHYGNGYSFGFYAEDYVDPLVGTYLYEFDLVFTITYSDVNDNYGNPTLRNDRNVVIYAKYPVILTDGKFEFRTNGGEFYGMPKGNSAGVSSGSLIENVISYNLADVPTVTMPIYSSGQSDRTIINIKFNESKSGTITLNVYRSKEPIYLGY